MYSLCLRTPRQSKVKNKSKIKLTLWNQFKGPNGPQSALPESRIQTCRSKFLCLAVVHMLILSHSLSKQVFFRHISLLTNSRSRMQNNHKGTNKSESALPGACELQERWRGHLHVPVCPGAPWLHKHIRPEDELKIKPEEAVRCNEFRWLHKQVLWGLSWTGLVKINGEHRSTVTGSQPKWTPTTWACWRECCSSLRPSSRDNVCRGCCVGHVSFCCCFFCLRIFSLTRSLSDSLM